MIKLITFNASGRIGHFNCEADERVVTIGRQEDNKIVLAGDRRVSRRLCEIYYDRDRWRIADVRHRSNRFAGKGSDNQIVIMIQKAGQPDSDPFEISAGNELCNQDMILIAGFKIRVELLKDMDEEVPLDLLYELKPLNARAKTPTVIQMEAVECGAASLSMVLGSHGLFVPLEELREECGVSRDGSKANNVLKAARKYGMNAKGYRYGLKKLFELKYPLILFWNFNHFVVLEGFRKGRVFVNDPAKGPRKISLEELDISFSGVVLTFEPGEKFEKGGVRSNMFGALLARMKGAETAIAYVILCGLLLVIPGLVVPTFTRIFIDEYLIANDAALLKPLLLGMGLTAVIRMLLTGLQEHYLLRYESKLALISSSRFFEHILRLPISYFTQRFPGEIGSRVMINDKVAQVLSNQFTTTLLNTFMIFFYALIMFAYDWLLTVVCICLSTLNIVVVKLISRKRIDASRRVLQETGKLTGTAMNGLQLMETLKATGSENDFFARWSGYQAKVLKGEQELSLISNLVNAVPPLLETLITTVILALGGYQIMNGVLTVGMLVAYQDLMKSFTNPLKNLVEFGGAIQELEGDMNRLDDVLRYPQDPQYTQEIRVADSIKNKTKLSGGVELKNITFGYSPLDKPLIEDFSLKVEPGKRVALVGGSGSGKSTVVRLLTGLYLPWSGEILFDGTRREEIPPSLLYSSIGIVDQDIFLFGASIRDNLTMWDSGVPDLNIISATRDAMIDEVIQTRASSYSSDMEEGGGNFSGGQRQRLEIARALVGFPTILLMDEATSALDPGTEKMINDNLRRRGCTCIIVAHRLSTIRDCDEIVVLQQGKIAERGTHEVLLEKKGIYADLIED